MHKSSVSSLVTTGLLWLIPDLGGESPVTGCQQLSEPPSEGSEGRGGHLFPLSLNSLQARTKSSSSDCATLPASNIRVLLEDSPSHFSWFSTLSLTCISTLVLCIRALSTVCHRYCQSYAHESVRKPTQSSPSSCELRLCVPTKSLCWSLLRMELTAVII